MSEAEPRGETAVRDLVSEDGEVRFTVAGPDGERQVCFWGDIPAQPAPPVEAAFAAALMPAMSTGGVLALPGPLSPQLQRSSPGLQAALISVVSTRALAREELSEVELTWPGSAPLAPPEPRPAAAAGVAAFFTGGVDSWWTLLANPDITDLIYVHGYDVPLDQPEVSIQVEERLAEGAERSGKRLRVLRTNLRDLTDPSVDWVIGHGAGLAAAALLFAPTCGRVLIAATGTYGEPATRGSHPLFDHLWSTELCRIEHDGAHLTRCEKIEQVAAIQEALDVLRVCWRNVDEYNCGRCEKCLRTMVALEALGALERCPTFTEPLDLEAVAELRLANPALLQWWHDNLDLARKRGAAPALTTAITACLEANLRRANEGDSADLRGQLEAATAREARLSAQLDEVVSSHSWRLTAPLRRAGVAARRLRRGATDA